MLFDDIKHSEHKQVEMDTAISVRNVSKMYPLYEEPRNRLKHALCNFLPNVLQMKNRKFYQEFWAVQDITFDAKKGEVFGVIGQNGSGKSTLLQIITGTLSQTMGKVHTNGRIAAMLELGSGFNPQFTGRENIYINSAILGFSRKETAERFDEIVAFADIGDFIDQPVKYYSSGMYVRLAFAVQACLEPDILIVDEVLSVGDIFFQQKCHGRIEELVAHGTAVILVTHNMNDVEKYCNKVMLLNKGRCIALGNPNEIIELYYQTEASRKQGVHVSSVTKATNKNENNTQVTSGTIPDWPHENSFLDLSKAAISGEIDVVRCTGIALCNDKNEPCSTFQIGDEAHFYYEFEFLKDIEMPVAGVVLTNSQNINVHGKTSLQYLVKGPTNTPKGTCIRFHQTMELAIMPGEYSFMFGLASISNQEYDFGTKKDLFSLHLVEHKAILRIRNAGRFVINLKAEGINLPFYGYTDLNGSCTLSVLNQ